MKEYCSFTNNYMTNAGVSIIKKLVAKKLNKKPYNASINKYYLH